jgi:hypothetical protein
MISDEQVLQDLMPKMPADARVVRNIDGSLRLERLLRLLPSHWRLEHAFAANSHGVITVIFSRDPVKARPGDFDYFSPIDAAPFGMGEEVEEATAAL